MPTKSTHPSEMALDQNRNRSSRAPAGPARTATRTPVARASALAPPSACSARCACGSMTTSASIATGVRRPWMPCPPPGSSAWPACWPASPRPASHAWHHSASSSSAKHSTPQPRRLGNERLSRDLEGSTGGALGAGPRHGQEHQGTRGSVHRRKERTIGVLPDAHASEALCGQTTKLTCPGGKRAVIAGKTECRRGQVQRMVRRRPSRLHVSQFQLVSTFLEQRQLSSCDPSLISHGPNFVFPKRRIP